VNRTKSIVVAGLLLNLLGFAEIAAATTVENGRFDAPSPRYEKGATFIYSNGRVERVVESADRSVTWATRSGRTYERHSSFFVPILDWRLGDTVGKRTVAGAPEKLWPLAVGNTSRFRVVTETEDRDGGRKRRSVELWRCHVAAVEKVETKSGPFDAHRIECERHSSETMRLLRRDVWHYAASVGHYVSRDSLNYGNGEREQFTLAYELSGADANRQRIRALLATLDRSED
jgi:hypothetical protein